MIIAVGDLHGRLDLLIQTVLKTDLKDVNFIQVGDFGLGFQTIEDDETMLSGLNDFFQSRNIFLFSIRGNHDNPIFWREEKFKFSNIKLVPDYTVLTVENKNILFVGGAISIDRIIRREGRNWWPDEIFNFDEEKLKSLNLQNLNYVVTHSAPQFAHPRSFNSLVYNYTAIDPNLEADLLKERQEITKFYDYLNHNGFTPSLYIYGHFHQSYREQIDDTEFILVGINEFLPLE